METILIIFMIFAAAICTFAVVLIALELVREIREKRNESKKTAPVSQSHALEEPKAVEEPKVVEEPKAEPAVEVELVVPEEQTQATDENGVWINTGKSQTLEEKYLALTEEERGWYDEIKSCAMALEGVKCLKNDRYEEYKLGNLRVVRLNIKRGVIQCEYVLINQDFRNYINDNKVTVKTAPTIIRVESPEAVAAAKSSIDIAMKAAEAEKEYKKEKQRERRRLARSAKNQ